MTQKGLTAVAISALVLCGCELDMSAQSPARGMFERTLTVNGPVDLNVRTGSGDIQIRTGDANRVHIVGRISAGRRRDGLDPAERVRQVEAAPPIQQSGNAIRIGDTQDDERYRNVAISYELVVPPNSQITSLSGSGDQTIGSVDGAVRAQTGSGDIQIERTGGSLQAQTGSGDIRVNAVAGEIMAQTGSGDIDVRQTAKAGVTAKTGSGDVNLTLPPDAAFTLDARTGSGSIDTQQPLTIQGQYRRNRVQGVVRGGGNNVTITTGSGSIRIR
jgi:hypothetical protein